MEQRLFKSPSLFFDRNRKSLFFDPSPANGRAAERSGGQKRPDKAGTGATRSPAQPDEHGEAPPFDRSEHGGSLKRPKLSIRPYF
jgi:hypothetical protein